MTQSAKAKTDKNSKSTQVHIGDRIADIRDRLSVISMAIDGIANLEGYERHGMAKLCNEMVDELENICEAVQNDVVRP
jgi:hypothetical protein